MSLRKWFGRLETARSEQPDGFGIGVICVYSFVGRESGLWVLVESRVQEASIDRYTNAVDVLGSVAAEEQH